MSASVENWLKRAAGLRGVLAVGVHLGDRTSLVRSNREELSPARLEQALKKLFDAVQLIHQNQIPGDRLRWSFESGQILCALHPGGVIAALFLNRDIVRSEEIENLLAAFTA